MKEIQQHWLLMGVISVNWAIAAIGGIFYVFQYSPVAGIGLIALLFLTIMVVLAK
jgi:hypothetical protein